MHIYTVLYTRMSLYKTKLWWHIDLYQETLNLMYFYPNCGTGAAPGFQNEIEWFLRLSHWVRQNLLGLQTPNVKATSIFSEELLVPLPSWVNSEGLDVPIAPFEEKLQEINAPYPEVLEQWQLWQQLIGLGKLHKLAIKESLSQSYLVTLIGAGSFNCFLVHRLYQMIRDMKPNFAVIFKCFKRAFVVFYNSVRGYT